MTRLPVVSGNEAVRAFARIGYRLDHETGCHLILRHESPPHRRLTVPTTGSWPRERRGASSGKLG